MQLSITGEVITLAGRFDVRSTGVVRDALYRTIAASDGDVIVDVSGLASIDVTALKLLAVATRTMERQGRRLVLRGCSANVRRDLATTRLRRHLQLERTS